MCGMFRKRLARPWWSREPPATLRLAARESTWFCVYDQDGRKRRWLPGQSKGAATWRRRTSLWGYENTSSREHGQVRICRATPGVLTP
jgi:hypothetical protein